jgi:diguanylate cyclase (GGDEF)-like protein
MGSLMMLIPLISAPFSATKKRLIPVYIAAVLCFFALYLLSKLPSLKRYIIWGLYVGFSLFFALAVYLSIFHSPHMRATVMIGVLCIMPLSFIDRPAHINLFVASWVILHTVLAYLYKPLFALDDTINLIAFSILGCFFGNITIALRVESYEAQRLLTIEKETDALTGLGNRRKLFDTLADQQAPKPTGILMIDIDHFKAYNDLHGHLAADASMKRLGILLHDLCERISLCFYRFGGEEFVGLAYSYQKEALSAIAEELRTTIEHSETFTISVGLAMWEDDTTTSYEEILDRADKAVFKAKAEGRNRVVVDTTVV